MKKNTLKGRTLLPPFESGQVWQLPDSHLRIGLVGRTLVHYKHYRGLAKRPPILLAGKGTLEKFLQQHGAVLLPEAAEPPSEPRTRRASGLPEGPRRA